MPRTSASCRSTEQAGFTLLELLVVLALIGLVAAMVAPGAIRGIQQAQARDFDRALAQALSSLPDRAAAEARTIELEARDVQRLVPDWPADVEVELPGKLRYAANGVADGGAFSLVRRGAAREQWTIAPITGEPVRGR